MPERLLRHAIGDPLQKSAVIYHDFLPSRLFVRYSTSRLRQDISRRRRCHRRRRRFGSCRGDGDAPVKPPKGGQRRFGSRDGGWDDIGKTAGRRAAELRFRLRSRRRHGVKPPKGGRRRSGSHYGGEDGIVKTTGRRAAAFRFRLRSRRRHGVKPPEDGRRHSGFRYGGDDGTGKPPEGGRRRSDSRYGGDDGTGQTTGRRAAALRFRLWR